MDSSNKPCNQPFFNVYPTRCLLRQPLPENRLPSNLQPANIPEPILGQGGGNQRGKGYLPEKGYDPTGYDDLNGLKYEIETEEELRDQELARQEEILDTAKEGMSANTNVPFWLNEPSILFSREYIFDAIPCRGMEENVLLNSAVRFAIYTFLITFILFRRTEGIYFILIVMIATILVKEKSKKEGYPPYMPSPPDPYGWSWKNYVVGVNRPEGFVGMPILPGNPDPYVLPKNWRERGSKKTGEVDVVASLTGLPSGQEKPMKNVEHYIHSNPREYITRKGPELVKKMLGGANKETKNSGFIPLTEKEGFTTYDASYYRPVSELTGELIERRNSEDMIQDPFCLAGRGYENIVGDPEKIRRKIYV